jgi:hypothetical protein
LIKELLQSGAKKNLDLIEEAAKSFADRFKSEENENPNDVKGRIGSVLDVMKKEGEVAFDGGMVALKLQKNEKSEEKESCIKLDKLSEGSKSTIFSILQLPETDEKGKNNK